MQYSASFLDWSNMKYVSPIISWKNKVGKQIDAFQNILQSESL